ncbi:MAG: hypothetical protein R2695_21630 [Acidimicrobiales bacterium]
MEYDSACSGVDEPVDNFVVCSSAVHRQRSRPDLCLCEESVEDAYLVVAGLAAGAREVETDLTDPGGVRQLTEEPVDLSDRSGTDPQWVETERNLDAGSVAQSRAKQPVVARILGDGHHSDPGNRCFPQDA